MTSEKQLLRSSAGVMSLAGVSRLTGYVKLILLTRLFGTGAAADAFTAANQLPELFAVLVSGGALAAALIPTFLSLPSAARYPFAHTIVTWITLILGALCLFGILAAGPMTRAILVPDFSPAQQAETARLMQIILLGTVIVGISSVYSSLLNAHHAFVIPAATSAMLDVGIILGLLIIPETFGIAAAAWGTVIGACLHLAVQLPLIRRHRIGFRWRLRAPWAQIRPLLWLMWPRLVSIGVVQVVDLFLIRIGSRLPTGTLAGYFYAQLFIFLPVELFGFTLARVYFPTLTDLHHRGDTVAARAVASQTLGRVWLLSVPATVGLWAIHRPLVSFLFERGAFDAAAVTLVSLLVAGLSLRILADATGAVLNMLFFARRNTLTPMLAGLVWLALHPPLLLGTVDRLGASALPFTTVTAAIALSCALLVLYQWRYGGLDMAWLGLEFGRTATAAAVMWVGIEGLSRLSLAPVLYLGLAVGGGAVLYWLTYRLLGGRQDSAIRRALFAR